MKKYIVFISIFSAAIMVGESDFVVPRKERRKHGTSESRQKCCFCFADFVCRVPRTLHLIAEVQDKATTCMSDMLNNEKGTLGNASREQLTSLQKKIKTLQDAQEAFEQALRDVNQAVQSVAS